MPAKFERCVRKVKKSGKARNAYAVCTTAMKRKKNSTATRAYSIFAKRGSGPRMHYDGFKFTNNGRPKFFGTLKRAADKARELVKRYAILKDYRVWVMHPKSTAR